MASKEQAVRDAAVSLKDAIDAAKAAGFDTQWPSNPDGLRGIAVSETKKASITVTVDPGADVPAETVAKAGVAAQKAADKVIGKA